MIEYPSLCFITAIMDRMHHIRQTLAVNLAQNKLPSTQFLVLDYGSTDGLREYIEGTFRHELQSGKLLYHYYSGSTYFHRSHSRNLAARLANTTIICNLDADNYTGPNFDLYLQLRLSGNCSKMVTALGNSQLIIGAFGRIAIHFSHFDKVGGYDEQFVGYGFEDYDLVSRLESSGIQKIVIEEKDYLQVLEHDNTERICRQETADQLAALYRQQLDNNMQVLLYLFRDHRLHYGLLIENRISSEHFRFSLAGNTWQSGDWHLEGNQLRIRFADFDAVLEQRDDQLIGHHHVLKRENRTHELSEAVIFHTNISNRGRYLSNIHNHVTRVNQNGYGEGQTHQVIH